MSRLRTRLSGLAVAGLAAAALGAAPAGAATVGHLTTEHRVSPLGVDAAKPRLGWTVDDARRGAAQRAYRIIVASSQALLAAGTGDVWDSGEVASATAREVAYGGPALQSGKRYFWKARVSLAGDPGGTWSDEASFETGLLSPSDWAGSSWIGRADHGQTDISPDLDGTSWIWHPDTTEGTAQPAEPRYFRRVIDVPAGRTVDDAQIVMAADDNYTLWVNGTELGGSPAKTSSWKLAYRWRFPLHAGRNVIAVAAFNTVASTGGTSAGLAGRMAGVLDDGTPIGAETGDGGWRSSTTDPTGWTTEGFDDSGWATPRTIVPFGQGPWGNQVVLQTPLPEQRAPAPILRNDFTTTKAVARARLTVAAGGIANVTIDGHPVDDRVLGAAPTDWTKRVPYTTSDVTSLVAAGPHTIAAQLGFGLFDMSQPTDWGWDSAPWRAKPELRAVLAVDYTDGTTERIVSGPDWTVHNGATLSDSPYGGESYDARKVLAGWDEPGYDDSGWQQADTMPAPAGALVAESAPPVRKAETLPATDVSRVVAGTWVASFARPVNGWVRLHTTAPAGTVVTLKYGERLAGGRVSYADSAVTGDVQTDTYTFSGDPSGETFTPQFSAKGFQFVEISGLPGTLTTADVTAEVLHAGVATIGGFSSSSPTLDALHARSVDTLLNNLQGTPTGTPAYDRTGATGPGHLAAESAMFNFNTTALHEKWLDDIGDTLDADGVPALIAPSPGYRKGVNAPTWGAALVLLPWWLHEDRGDDAVLTEHYAEMAAYVRHELDRQVDGLSSTAYGDWGAPDAVGDVSPEDPRVAGTAYVYLMAKTMASAATATGHTADAATFTTRAAQVAAAFNAAFLDRDRGRYRSPLDPDGTYRQSHNVLALAFGLVPAADEARVAASLAADVRSRGLDTGALASKELLPVLTEHGFGDLAYQLATKTEGPSWGGWLAGESSSPASELWSSPRSLDNALLTTVDDWLWQDVAGLRGASDGYAAFDVDPHLVGTLTHAAARTETPRGTAAVDWTRSGGVLTLKVTVPVGSTARVHVPTGVVGHVSESGGPAPTAAGVTATGTDDTGSPTFDVRAGTYVFATGATFPADPEPVDDQPVAAPPAEPSAPATPTPPAAPSPSTPAPAPKPGPKPTPPRAATPKIACRTTVRRVRHKRVRSLRCTITVAAKATLRATAKRGRKTVATGKGAGRLVLTIPGTTTATLTVTATPKGVKAGPRTRTVTKKVKR